MHFSGRPLLLPTRLGPRPDRRPRRHPGHPRVAAGLAAALLPLASAAATDACVAGAWRGTVGGTPVSIVLNAAQDDQPAVGRYYYRNSLDDLTLVRDPKTDVWRELDARERHTGWLTLACDTSTLRGEWRSPDGAKRLPIAAMAIPAEAYGTPRKAGLRPRLDKTGAIDGRRFEHLTYAVPDGARTQGQSLGITHQGVRLIGSGPGIDALNATLQAKAVDAVMEHLECVAAGRQDRGVGAGYGSSQVQSVTAWNASFAVIQTSLEGYCGGAHPWHGNHFATYRLDTGAAVDTANWLLPELRQEIPKSSTLGRLLMKAYERTPNGPDADCRDAIRWDGRAVHAAAGQIVFEGGTSYAMTPCAEDIALPIDVIQPFLTPVGREALKAFR